MCWAYISFIQLNIGHVNNKHIPNCGRPKGGQGLLCHHGHAICNATCRSSLQEKEFVSPPLESWLTLWALLAKRSDRVTFLNHDFQRLGILPFSYLVPCLAAMWRNTACETSWRIPASSQLSSNEPIATKENRTSYQTYSWQQTHQWAQPRPDQAPR